jgi:hypothetical protein
MAEVAGLAIASVGLLGLFDSLVQGIRCIMLANDFESDLRPYLVSLYNARLCVCRWGETIGLTEGDLHEAKLLENFDSAKERDGALKTLREINELTDKIMKKSMSQAGGKL